MIRSRLSIFINRGLGRRHVKNLTTIQLSLLQIAKQSTSRSLSSVSETVRVIDDDTTQSFDERTSLNSGPQQAEALESLLPNQRIGPPESAVKRALKNEPDEEWDVIVEYTNAFKIRNIPDELNEIQEDIDSTDSDVSQTNVMFYDWQWKIIGTQWLGRATLHTGSDATVCTSTTGVSRNGTACAAAATDSD
jgi:hypothetical protein